MVPSPSVHQVQQVRCARRNPGNYDTILNSAAVLKVGAHDVLSILGSLRAPRTRPGDLLMVLASPVPTQRMAFDLARRSYEALFERISTSGDAALVRLARLFLIAQRGQ